MNTKDKHPWQGFFAIVAKSGKTPEGKLPLSVATALDDYELNSVASNIGMLRLPKGEGCTFEAREWLQTEVLR